MLVDNNNNNIIKEIISGYRNNTTTPVYDFSSIGDMCIQLESVSNMYI